MSNIFVTYSVAPARCEPHKLLSFAQPSLILRSTFAEKNFELGTSYKLAPAVYIKIKNLVITCFLLYLHRDNQTYMLPIVQYLGFLLFTAIFLIGFWLLLLLCVLLPYWGIRSLISHIKKT